MVQRFLSGEFFPLMELAVITEGIRTGPARNIEIYAANHIKDGILLSAGGRLLRPKGRKEAEKKADGKKKGLQIFS
jgi:hypothetical protein